MRRMIRFLLALAVIVGLHAAPPLGAAEPPTATARLPRAQQAYLAYCGMCHGPQGAGDGEVTAALKRSNIIVPRLDDATRLERIGRDGVLRIIREGGAHVGRSNVMPEWGELVGTTLAGDLAGYVMSLADQGPGLSAVTLQRYLKSPPGVPEQGRSIYVYRCSACHGPGGKGDGPSSRLLQRKHGVRPRDLTDARFARSKTDQDLFAVISLGGRHASRSVYMPASADNLTPGQIMDLVAYLRQISKTAARK
jgi:mono/diheme cytochrome c family protein